jgi:hypothetical protein
MAAGSAAEQIGPGYFLLDDRHLAAVPPAPSQDEAIQPTCAEIWQTFAGQLAELQAVVDEIREGQIAVAAAAQRNQVLLDTILRVMSGDDSSIIGTPDESGDPGPLTDS